MRPVACLLVAVALGLAGCGGDDKSDGGTGGTTPTTAVETSAPMPSDKDKVRATLEGVLASGDPALACERLVTPRYVRDSYGDAAGCRQSQGPGAAATRIRIIEIRVNGDTATAVALPTGGPSSGVRLNATLIREGRDWKLDGLRSNEPPGP